MYEVWFEIVGVNWSEFMYNFEEIELLKPNLRIITSFLQLHFVKCQYLKSLETPRIFITRIKHEQAIVCTFKHNSFIFSSKYPLQKYEDYNTLFRL